jgi:Protein of unknown function (DUF3626)
MVRRGEAAVRLRLADVLQRAGRGIEAYPEAMECTEAHARVVLHFHPDRLGVRRLTVADALLTDGVYRNQFETGLSSGSMSAFSGGARDTWERRTMEGSQGSGSCATSELSSLITAAQK